MKLIDIIKKDLRIVLRDIKALIFIIIMPVVLIVILSLALNGVFTPDSSVIEDLHVAIVDETDEAELQGLMRMMSDYGGDSSEIDNMSIYTVLDSEEVSSFLSYEKTDRESAKKMLDSGEADAVITIPAGTMTSIFTSIMTVGNGAEVTVEGAVPGSLQENVVKSITSAWADAASSAAADLSVLFDTLYLEDAISQQVIESLDIESYMRDTTQSLQQGTGSIVARAVTARRSIDSFLYYSIAITCMFVLYSAGQGSAFLYNEYEDKTLMRLLAAGITRRKLLLGKGAAVFCLCAMQLIVLFLFSSLALGVDWGNPLGFIMTSICVAVSVTGLGVLLMVLVYRSGNPRIGNVFQAVLVQVLALFGGSFLPLFTLPPFFSTVSLVTPNGLAIRAFTENATGAALPEILPYLGGCLLLGAALTLLGIVLFPRERRA